MKLYDKCTRNYFELKPDHECALTCKEHKWWCIIHIRGHDGCDCKE